MRVLVIGANGNTGTRIVRRLSESGNQAIAMVRSASQKSKFDDMNVEVRAGDLEHPIDDVMEGIEAVIFAAGSGGQTGKDKTVLVDHLGAIRSMVTAQVHNVSRYVMLSSINNDVNSTSPIAHYHKAKAHADNHLQETDLEYTIVCPGGLTNEESSGSCEITPDLHGRGLTSRELLAEVIVRSLDMQNTIRKCFSLLDGNTPIEEAMRAI